MTAEEYLKKIVSDMVFQVAALGAERDALKAELVKTQAALAAATVDEAHGDVPAPKANGAADHAGDAA